MPRRSSWQAGVLRRSQEASMISSGGAREGERVVSGGRYCPASVARRSGQGQGNNVLRIRWRGLSSPVSHGLSVVDHAAVTRRTGAVGAVVPAAVLEPAVELPVGGTVGAVAGRAVEGRPLAVQRVQGARIPVSQDRAQARHIVGGP